MPVLSSHLWIKLSFLEKLFFHHLGHCTANVGWSTCETNFPSSCLMLWANSFQNSNCVSTFTFHSFDFAFSNFQWPLQNKIYIVDLVTLLFFKHIREQQDCAFRYLCWWLNTLFAVLTNWSAYFNWFHDLDLSKFVSLEKVLWFSTMVRTPWQDMIFGTKFSTS